MKTNCVSTETAKMLRVSDLNPPFLSCGLMLQRFLGGIQGWSPGLIYDWALCACGAETPPWSGPQKNVVGMCVTRSRANVALPKQQQVLLALSPVHCSCLPMRAEGRVRQAQNR